jgi:hypothetical protein
MKRRAISGPKDRRPSDTVWLGITTPSESV